MKTLVYFAVILTFGFGIANALSKDSENRIVGGQVEDIVLHPFQISMRNRQLLRKDSAFSHICGGSIYNERIIITAAHCVISRVPSMLQIVAGSNIGGTGGVIVGVKDIIFHENYNPNTTDSDIAILVLKSPLPLNGFNIKSIELADQEYPEGSTCYLSGWGKLKSSDNTVPYFLNAVTVSLVNREKCQRSYSILRQITEGMICAASRGRDTCQGDSGGPLVINGKLAGVVSWGFGCAVRFFPGVYANVFYFRSWILEKVAEAEKLY